MERSGRTRAGFINAKAQERWRQRVNRGRRTELKFVPTMMNSSTSAWLGITFVLVGALNVWLVLQASARVRDTKASTLLIAAHRVGGYLFITLFCVMGYFMLTRLGQASGSASPGTMIHLTLAMVLSPLIFV